MQKRILITGASGFIGSFLVEKSLLEGYETWAGIRSSSSREFLQDDRILFADLSLGNKTILKEQIASHAKEYGAWDYVIHNAGITKCLDKSDFNKVNYQYTVNLVEALRETGCIPEKFILISSLSADNPNTAYGRSKKEAETFLLSMTDFPSLIMRPTGVYGPREKDYFLMMKTIRLGLDVAAGWQEQRLTFIYVTDLAQAIFLALSSKYTHKVYPVSDGKVYTDKEYTQLVKQGLGKRRVIRIKIPLFVLYSVSCCSEAISCITKKPSTLNTDKYQIMKQRDWTCDTNALFNDLSFRPEYDLRQGIDSCVGWYRANGWL